MAQNKIQARRSGSEVTSISKITPIAAKPNEVVSLTGSNFYEAKNLKVSLELANGERATVPLAITNTTTASFTMPNGVGLGVKDVTLTQGSSQVEVARFNLIVDQADNQLPIWIGDASEICNTRDYIDRNGDTKTGTKDCASGVTPPACSENGSIGCVTTETYKAADLTNLSASNIKSGVTIAGVTGTVTQSPGDCWANGQQGCVVNGSYFAGTMCLGNDSNCFIDDFGGPTNLLKAVNYSSILTNASNIRRGVTISDVTGTLDDCSANAVTGCVTTATYQSADLTNLSAGNIKSGVTIAGTAGQYPSSSFQLTGSSGSDLTTATFNAQIKSSATFQYFGSDGVRYTGTGDADILDSNIKSSEDIFGTIGNVMAAVAPDPWNVRVGATINGVTGKLKVNCRNRANPTLFDIDAGQAATITIGSPGSINITGHGLSNGTMVRINYLWAPTGLNHFTTYYVVNAAPDTLQLSTTSGGAAINITGAGANVTVHRWQASPQSIDIWDTIDDYNNVVAGLPPSVLTAWGNNTDCGGVDDPSVSTDDDNVWKDVTTAGTGAASCSGSPERCTMQDKITGLSWSKLQAKVAWNTAWSNCQNLNYNGQTGWRLPTQKELMEAYTHGIRSIPSAYAAANTNWMAEGNMNAWFWSGSSISSNTSSAWTADLAYGWMTSQSKGSEYQDVSRQVVCVR
jgi:hypothetical protein